MTICLVIVALFIGDFVNSNISVLIAVLFTVAMLLIIAGLVFFLREVGLATKHMRQGMEIALDEAPPDPPS